MLICSHNYNTPGSPRLCVNPAIRWFLALCANDTIRLVQLCSWHIWALATFVNEEISVEEASVFDIMSS